MMSGVGEPTFSGDALWLTSATLDPGAGVAPGAGLCRPEAAPWARDRAHQSPMTVQRRLAAVLAADVVGFSALMSRDEEGTLARIKALERDVIAPAVQQHHGRVVKTTGDGFLVEFASPVEAVRCALAVQKALASGPFSCASASTWATSSSSRTATSTAKG